MADPIARPPLQGQVTRQVSFQEVIDQNPEGWAKETPEVKNKVADAFFQKHVATQPGFTDEAPEKQNEVRTNFNKQYDVGHVSLSDGFADDPLSKTLGPIHRAADLATLGIPARAWDAAKFTGTSAGDIRDAQLGQYSTDPGMLGDMYRFSTSGIGKGLGSMTGAFKQTGNMVGQTAQSGLGTLLSTVGNGSKYIKPWLGDAQKAAFTTAATMYSGLNNATSALRGEQNPLEAATNTVLDTASLPLGGRTRLGNATVQGGVGGLQSIISDLLHGSPVDVKKAIEEALLQAGVGGAFPEGGKQKGTLVRGVNRAQSVGVRAPGKPHNIQTPNAQKAEQLRQSVQEKVTAAANYQSVTQTKTQKAKVDALQKQHDALNHVVNNPYASSKEKQVARTLQAQIRQTHNQLAADYQRQHGSAPKTEKRVITEQADLSNVVALVKDMRAKGNVKQANRMLDAFHPDTKARIFDEVHKQEKVDKQAVKAAPKKPASGTPVADVLLDALKEATGQKKAGTTNEHVAPGPDPYKRMAQDAKTAPKQNQTEAKPDKTAPKKPTKKANDKPKSKAQELRERREDATTTLQALAKHHDWGEQPATDLLNRYGIDHPKSKQGSVLHYRVWIPGKGWVHFKHNASINNLFEKTGKISIASRIANQKGGLDKLRAELKELSFDADSYEGEMHKLYEQAEQEGRDVYEARNAEENAYYERVDQSQAELTDALESARTPDDLADVFDKFDSEAYQDMPPEFFENMYEAYAKHVERVENGENRGSTQPEGSTGKDSQNVGRPQGADGRQEYSAEITKADLMPVEQMRQTRKDAVEAGETVKIRYWAERTGETGEFQYKTLHDVRVIPGKDGRETKWTGVNADGQLHTYIERNKSGNLKDSNIISVERTGKKSEFERVLHPETGSPAVRHMESGEIIPQIVKQGVKSSSLHAKMNELITAVSDGKRVPVDRILDTAREFNAQRKLETQLEGMTQEQRAALYEQRTGSKC